MEPILTVEQVKEMIEKERATVIDVRSNLQDPDQGEQEYHKAHLPGAFYLHLERDLSGKKQLHGGNHPLPPQARLEEKLQQFGVQNNKPIIIYGTDNDMFAGRAWWLLHYLGHPEVYVLDGGYKAWVQQDYETTADIPKVNPSNWEGETSAELTAAIDEVQKRPVQSTLIDSRAPNRYTGEVEPMYHKAGHIPGAVNYFWKDVLQEDGSWKTKAQLQEHFSYLNQADEIIVSCGSGVSACPNYIALKRAGFENVKLYPGSYSDWISYEDNDVHQGEEP